MKHNFLSEKIFGKLFKLSSLISHEILKPEKYYKIIRISNSWIIFDNVRLVDKYIAVLSSESGETNLKVPIQSLECMLSARFLIFKQGSNEN